MVIHYVDVKMSHLSVRLIEAFLSTFSNVDQYFVLCAYSSMLFGSKDEEVNKYDVLFKKYDFSGYQYVFSEKEFVDSLVKNAKQDNKLILHGYFRLTNSLYKIRTILLKTDVLRHIVFVHWGVKKYERTTLKQWITHGLQSYFYRHIGNNIVLIDGDKNVLMHNYGCLNNVEVIPYFNSEKEVAQKYKLIGKKRLLSGRVRVMVSHSGHIHNQHINVYQVLKERFDDCLAEISSPLCYGPKDYIEQVISEGKKLFGDRYTYFTRLKPWNEYVDYICNHDIYISAAEIQTGLFAVSTALGNGLKVYVNGLVYEYMQQKGSVLYKYDLLGNESAHEFTTCLSESQIKNNYLIFTEPSTRNDTVMKWSYIMGIK